MKERLDILLYMMGYAPSREKAKAMIAAGLVYVNGRLQEKAGALFEPCVSVEVRGEVLPYVSRGGLKLEKAVREFSLDLKGLVCMDVGASTGGFTDCMLQNGAAKVYAVDVGSGQLAEKLRRHPSVVCMEKTNIRYVTLRDIGELIEFVSVDVSFISLTKVLIPVRELMAEGACCVCLIKPQFEAGRERVGKNGVVRDEQVHREVVESVVEFAQKNGFSAGGLTYSPVRGPEGNIEYLMLLKKVSDGMAQTARIPEIAALVEESHARLLK